MDGNPPGNTDPTSSVMQDGVRCPHRPPWSPWVSKVTGLPFLLILGLAVYALFPVPTFRLWIWLAAFVVFAYPLRYLVCARCPYYGMDCSSMFGRLVTKMFKKQEGKSMIVGLWLDVFFFAFLFAYPFGAILQAKGFLFILAWIASFMLAFIVLTRLACTACPFTFCPIGKGGRFIWDLLE